MQIPDSNFIHQADAYLRGEMTPEEEAAFEALLAADPVKARLFREHRAMSELIRQYAIGQRYDEWQRKPPPPRPGLSSKMGGKMSVWLPIVGIAASLLLLLFFWWSRPPKPVPPDEDLFGHTPQLDTLLDAPLFVRVIEILDNQKFEKPDMGRQLQVQVKKQLQSKAGYMLHDGLLEIFLPSEKAPVRLALAELKMGAENKLYLQMDGAWYQLQKKKSEPQPLVEERDAGVLRYLGQ